MDTYTATITEAQDNWTQISITVSDSSGEWQDTIWLVTSAYTFTDPDEDGHTDVESFDDSQFMADLTEAFAAGGWIVTDWTGSNPDGTGAIQGATLTKSN